MHWLFLYAYEYDPPVTQQYDIARTLDCNRKSAKWIFTHLPSIKNLVRVICLGAPAPYLGVCSRHL